jgi:CRISPR-associated protein Csx10
MIRYRLQVEALSPLTFGARHGTSSNISDTLDYIPGTALRGAVAARFLQAFGDADDENFKHIFLRDGVLFSNLYPLDQQDSSAVWPRTAYACKPYKEQHGVKDILLSAAALKMGSFAQQHLLDEIMTCAVCGQPTHQLSGIYETTPGNPVPRQTIEVYKRLITHVGIHRQRQSASEGFLYSQQVINEVRPLPKSREFLPQLFSGELLIAPELYDFIAAELMPDDTIFRTGEGRSRGQGKVRIARHNIIEADSTEALHSRIEQFNKECKLLLSREGRVSFSLTLQSDAIFTDEFMRPQQAPSIDHLRRALGADAGVLATASASLAYANAGTKLLQSWNVAAGYPKPDAIAVTAGSVFLFQVECATAEDLAQPLAMLQERGIGKRRSEGFGRVTVCDSFHLEGKELWQVIK